MKNLKSTVTLSNVVYQLNGIPVFIQRLMALVLILLLSPILLITYLAIRIESRGPVLFKQIRVGKLGERFLLYKFRSMYLSCDPKYVLPNESTSDRDGVCKKYFNDPRITKVGKWIRKLSIDELPQLFNVIKGEMALIGPRPALPVEVDSYELTHYRRLDTLPGLTGLWQVSGRANTSTQRQLSLDAEYLDKQSIGLDIKILLLTLPVVLRGEGAY